MESDRSRAALSLILIVCRIEVDAHGEEIGGCGPGCAQAEPAGEVSFAQDSLALDGIVVVGDVRGTGAPCSVHLDPYPGICLDVAHPLGVVSVRRDQPERVVDEAIADGLDKFPDINAINNDLPPSSDPDIGRAADQLRDVLAKCAIGATEFRKKFPRAQLERMVKLDLAKRFKEDPKYSEHVRGDVPGSSIRAYSSRGRTSSKGTFVKTNDYASGGGLDALLTGGWLRVAKDRIDPVAWSHQFGFERKTERQSWRHHFVITERNGKQSPLELAREKLAGTGASAIRLLMKAGVHVVGRDVAQNALVQFLRFKPRREIIRMPRVGWPRSDRIGSSCGRMR